MKRLFRVLICGGLVLIGTSVFALGGAMFFENAFIFFPIRYPQGDWSPAGLAYEDVFFQAANGPRLHGWYVPHDQPRAVILYCHGNAGNITHRADVLRVLHNQVKVSVFIFDYRGYGRSEGKPSEAGLLADARAARAWLAKREGIGEKEIVLLGRSLGGAVAVDLAADQGARGLILESTFSSLPDLAAYHYRWLPVRYLLRTKFDSLSKIPRYRGPLLQSHGTADRIVPIRYGQRLFQAASEPKQFFTIAGGRHNEMPPAEYYQLMADFLEKLPE